MIVRGCGKTHSEMAQKKSLPPPPPPTHTHTRRLFFSLTKTKSLVPRFLKTANQSFALFRSLRPWLFSTRICFSQRVGDILSEKEKCDNGQELQAAHNRRGFSEIALLHQRSRRGFLNRSMKDAWCWVPSQGGYRLFCLMYMSLQ